MAGSYTAMTEFIKKNARTVFKALPQTKSFVMHVTDNTQKGTSATVESDFTSGRMQIKVKTAHIAIDSDVEETKNPYLRGNSDIPI